MHGSGRQLNSGRVVGFFLRTRLPQLSAVLSSYQVLPFFPHIILILKTLTKMLLLDDSFECQGVTISHYCAQSLSISCVVWLSHFRGTP